MVVGGQAASFLEDEEEDDFEAVAGAAEESLMADGSYLHASALDEPFGWRSPSPPPASLTHRALLPTYVGL